MSEPRICKHCSRRLRFDPDAYRNDDDEPVPAWVCDRCGAIFDETDEPF